MGKDSPSGNADPKLPQAIIAYDGSDLARFAIEQAGRHLASGLDAIVVCVWRPGDVGFKPLHGRRLRTAATTEVRRAAEETAAQGAELAEKVGFRARSRAIQAAPTWRGLVEVAEDNDCDLIVIGSTRFPGLVGLVTGSVASDTVSHFRSSVLVIRIPEFNESRSDGIRPS
jgi:nucleotide-binding universal stress UspA family protein